MSGYVGPMGFFAGGSQVMSQWGLGLEGGWDGVGWSGRWAGFGVKFRRQPRMRTELA